MRMLALPCRTGGNRMTGTTDMETDARPVDIAMMRETVDRLLLLDVELPEDGELDTLTSLLRGHIQLVIPEVQSAAAQRPKGDVSRYCALACAGESRGRLNTQPVSGGDFAYARRLARSLAALCDHHDNLRSEQPTGGGEQPPTQTAPSGFDR